jgi:hypothetical protein
MTVMQAMADSSPHLFVMNRVSEDKKFEPGNINLNVKGDDGGMTVIVIPATFIPVDMSLFISKNNLLTNQAFRRLDAANKISIIHPEDAASAIENEPRAQKELNRILNINNEHGGYSRGDNEEFIEMKATKSGSGDTNLAPLAEINRFAIGIVQRSSTEDVADLIADIESRAHTLEIHDLEYIAQNVEDATLKQFIVEYVSNN